MHIGVMTRDQKLLAELKRDAAAIEQHCAFTGKPEPWLANTLRRAAADLEARIARGERNIRPEDLA